MASLNCNIKIILDSKESGIFSSVEKRSSFDLVILAAALERLLCVPLAPTLLLHGKLTWSPSRIL